MINNVLVWKQQNISWIHPINIDSSINANNFNFDYLDTLNKLRSSNLKILELRDIADKISDGPFGSQLKVEEYKEQGFPVYRVKNVIDTQILDDDIVYIDAKKQQQLKRSEVLPGDVLITKAGRIGSAAVVPSKFGNGNITSHLVLVRLKKTINNYYLVAYLECKYGKVITGRESYKSTRPELTKNEIGNVIIPIPSPEIQKYIGDKVRKAEELREEAKRLMGELDNKINNLFNFTYSMSSKGTFVSPNLLDEDRLDSSYYSTDNIEAKKTILKFSNIRKLRDIAYITDGDHGKPEFKENGVLFIRNKNVKKYLINLDDVVYIDRAYEDKYLKSSRLQFEDILLTKIGTIGESAVFLGNEGNLNANSALIRVKDRNLISPYCLCAILNSNIYQLILNKESGGGVQSALSLSRLGEIIVPILDKDIQIEIENMFKLYIDKKETVDKLIQEAKQDVEDLIEGNFDMSKVKANS